MTEEEIAVKLAEQAKEIGSLKHRMDDVEKIVDCVHQLAQEMVGLTKEIKFMTSSIDSLTDRVTQLDVEITDLKSKPGKRWEQVVAALVSAGAGAWIAQFFAK